MKIDPEVQAIITAAIREELEFGTNVESIAAYIIYELSLESYHIKKRRCKFYG